MLDEAVERHGRPSHERLTEHFATELIGPIAASGSRAPLSSFWE
jgi:hypothetical protein